MKKILITMYLILLSFFTMTFKVQAYTTSISNAEITGTDLVQTNTSFSQSFKVNFSNLKKGTTDTLGIWLVGYELVYDETILIIEDISNDGSVWDSVIFKDDGKIYVISEFANDPFKNACVDGVLYCADYLTTIKFYLKDTDLTSTTIKMKEISAEAFPVSDDMNPSYVVDDAIDLEYPNTVNKVINIAKSTTISKKEPNSIISTTTPKIEMPTTQNSSSTTNNNKELSNNKYLKSLSIENYEIFFNKETKSYTINISEDTNKLNITAIPEEEKANVEIIGADDLKKNNYKVIIKVTAENNEKETYEINAKFVEKNDIENEEVLGEKEESKLKNILNFDKKTIIYISIGIGILIIIILIFIITNHINNKKIDKSLDF